MDGAKRQARSNRAKDPLTEIHEHHLLPHPSFVRLGCNDATAQLNKK
jgi:hypothetical protein